MTATNFLRRKARPIHRETAPHLFTVGQAVRLRSGFSGPLGCAGIYHITGTLPPTGESPQYRIRSDDEHYERMTTQESLEAVLISAGESATLIEGTFGHGRATETQEAGDHKAEAGKGPAEA